jgi:predicted acylesterase/phospholipase RssA
MADPTCDLILKGGLTSGVVYPPAVCRLAETYRLVNIGGASAGAIAAAATAAAEYGRQHGHGGYAVLAGLPADLGTRKAGRTALLSLFEPQARTRPLFRVLLAALGRKGFGRVVRVVGTALVAESASAAGWWRVLLGALPGVAVLLLAVFATAFPWSIVLGVLGAVALVAGVLAGTGWALVRRLLLDVPGNYLGVVNGTGSAAALTPWLTTVIDKAAGRENGAPLTVADLWGAADKHEKWLCYHDSSLRRINLEVMTTNLGEGRPQRLPLLQEGYFFNEHEFRQLFPDRVVDVMAHAEDIVPREPADQRAYDELTFVAAKQGYRRMPLADLPVVVAARLSLSFPVLLSAVPLYTFDAARPRRCWISDGGITSNMPLHFFDAPLPRRPTFAVNLRTDDTSDTDAGPTLPGFLAAVATTMQNWVDNAQMRIRLPGTYLHRGAHSRRGRHEPGHGRQADRRARRRRPCRCRRVAARVRAGTGRRLALPPVGALSHLDSHGGTDVRAVARRVGRRSGRRCRELPRDGRRHRASAGVPVSRARRGVGTR